MAGTSKSRGETTKTLRLKVTLQEVKPPVWRRILVSSNDTLQSLHDIIQLCMGWTDSHLHQFIASNGHYGPPTVDGVSDERAAKIGDVLRRKGDKLVYEYDFGDSWMHFMAVESVEDSSPVVEVPCVLEGARACPPEDCGGSWGYRETLQILVDPKHPDHEERLQWIGGKFDPEHFDANAINVILRRHRLRRARGA